MKDLLENVAELTLLRNQRELEQAFAYMVSSWRRREASLSGGWGG
jgi:hypothetical protein